MDYAKRHFDFQHSGRMIMDNSIKAGDDGDGFLVVAGLCRKKKDWKFPWHVARGIR